MRTSGLWLLAIPSIVVLAAPLDYGLGLSRRATNGKSTGPNPIDPIDPPPNRYPNTPPEPRFIRGEAAPRHLAQAQEEANECVDKCWNIYWSFRIKFLSEDYGYEPWQIEQRDRNGARSCHESCATTHQIASRYVKMPEFMKDQFGRATFEGNDNHKNGFLGRNLNNDFKSFSETTTESAKRLGSTLARVWHSAGPTLEDTGGHPPAFAPGGVKLPQRMGPVVW